MSRLGPSGDRIAARPSMAEMRATFVSDRQRREDESVTTRSIDNDKRRLPSNPELARPWQEVEKLTEQHGGACSRFFLNGV
jgi:hypothetical protein